jgi:hypothetical protein
MKLLCRRVKFERWFNELPHRMSCDDHVHVEDGVMLPQLLQKRAQGLLACAMESLESATADSVSASLTRGHSFPPYFCPPPSCHFHRLFNSETPLDVSCR